MHIGVFDSGIGGWTILYQLLQDMPGHEYIYLADRSHAPYSEKSLAEIISFSKENVRFFAGFWLRSDCRGVQYGYCYGTG
ncbi:hypothetical protein LRY60_05355 [Candidatus Woesebacteria bacterium]|nr:hypothetical protein [Candidatus Woesebacteria bacterium]